MPPLARKYAGVLGTLALFITVVRAIKDSSGSTSAIWTAICCLLFFAVVGVVVGWLADWIVVESVKMQVEQQIQQPTGPDSKRPSPTAARPK